MRLHAPLVLGVCVAVAAAVGACSSIDLSEQRGRHAGDGGSEPIPGGDLPDEQFPPELLAPYTGPAIDNYDNTILAYPQLRARVDAIFHDAALGGDTNAFFSEKIALLGGADFTQRFAEAREATPDYLLGLDGIAKEACGRAAANKTGPFGGTTPENATDKAALVKQLYQRMLFRSATSDETTSSAALVDDLTTVSTPVLAWAGLCEVLVRHPDFMFTLPPSVTTTAGAEKERLQLTKIAIDFIGRPPTDTEVASLAGKTTAEKLDFYFGLPEFKDFYFHLTRLRTESTGTPEADEPARLWTALAVSGGPMQELFTADYSIDANFNKTGRGPEHGRTGMLTMPGFIKSKPGLPHFNYAARVMSDYMGTIFDVTPDIVAARLVPAASTTAPGSSCLNCHGVLTPLEHQRARWADDGTYHSTDANGAPIDDTDQGLVADYPFKGEGMEAFSLTAVKKEKFLLQTFQSQFLFFMGRPMRAGEDERTVFLELWKNSFKNNGNLKELLKVMASVPSYLGNQ